MNRRLLLSLLALLVLLGAAGLAYWEYRRPPSILLITIDTMRPDRLGCYGHPTNKTPGIDRLAEEGMLFERAYCDMPWTTGSMASVMTGRYSNEHGLRDPMSKLDANVVTIAQILQEHQLQTGAVVGSFPLDSVYGLDRGFESYDDTFTMPVRIDPGAPVEHVDEPLPEKFADQRAFVERKQENDWYRPDEDVTNAAINWLEHLRDGRPFFLWVHYFGPHEKLDRTRNNFSQEPEIIAAYDGDVEKTDHAVGRLLDHLRQSGIIDKTLVILHADHGQNLGESDYVGHTLRLDEVAVRIPLIIRFPRDITGGLRRRDIAKNLDIFPTLLAAWKIAAEPRPGRSLLPTKADPLGLQIPKIVQSAYFETYLPQFFFWPQTTASAGTLLGPMVSRGVRTPSWKFLMNEFRGACVSGKSPIRDGNGKWAVQQPTPLPAERCVELGAKEIYADTALYGLQPVDPPPVDVMAVLEAEVHEQDDRKSGKVGEKFDLSPHQEEKLKSLGYLR